MSGVAMEPEPPTTAVIAPVLGRCERKRKTPDCGGGGGGDDHKDNNPAAPAMVASAASPVCLSSSLSNFAPIDSLTDELLVEIFHRLPLTKHIFGCKCVCKRWSNLIASGDLNLIGGFIGRRRRQEGEMPFGLVAQSNDWRKKKNRVRVDNVLRKVTSKEPLFKSSGLFSLDFLPNCEQSESIWILASFNDLLVCCPSIYDHSVFYICNPFTKQWIELPPPPRCSEWARLNVHEYRNDTMMGRIKVVFICDPYCYSDDEETGIVQLNSGYRFKLVCLPAFITKISESFVDVFSSETGEWSSLVLQGRRIGSCINSVVAYNGMVYWLEQMRPRVTFTGFNLQDNSRDGGVVSACPFNRLPSQSGEIEGFGMFQGNLRILKYQRNLELRPFDENFSVWELKDSQWCLIHKDIRLYQFASKDERVARYLKSKRFCTIIDGVTFHPSDGDIVYLQFSRFSVMCNMLTRTVEMDGKATRRNIQPSNHHGVFPLLLPWWPTPVPVLPKK